MKQLTQGKVKEGMSEAGAKSADLWMVPVGEIHVIKGFNVRAPTPELEAHITWLQGQMETLGYDRHKPLAGYVAQEGDKNRIYVYDGHCRLEAAKRAIKGGLDLESIPVVIAHKGTNMADLTAAMDTAASAKPLQPIERAEICKRLLALNWDEDKISTRLGMTKPYINDLLELLASDPIRQAVTTGKISATTAMKVIKDEGENAAAAVTQAVAKAAARGKTRATAKDLAPAKAASGELAKAVLKFDESRRPLIWLEPSQANDWAAIVKLARGEA